MVERLETRLLELAVSHKVSATEVMIKYEEIYQYVLSSHPLHTQKVYEEISYIRTRNWVKAYKGKSEEDTDPSYGHGVW